MERGREKIGEGKGYEKGEKEDLVGGMIRVRGKEKDWRGEKDGERNREGREKEGDRGEGEWNRISVELYLFEHS